MFHLLFIEWLKLKKYTTFWVLSTLFAGLFLLWNYGISSNVVKMGSGPVDLISSSYSFPAVWANMGFVYSWFVFFLAFLVIISIANEFSFRTHRQHVIDGMHRLNVIQAKVLLILTLSLFATAFYFLSALVFGAVNGGGNPLSGMEHSLYVMLYTVNYLSFAGLLAFLLRRTGLAVVLLFAYLLAETMLGKLINWQTSSQWGNLLPLQCSDELLPLPMMKSLGGMMPGTTADLPVMVYVFTSLLYIGLYYLLIRRKFLRNDW